ncbi:MAG: MOSC domain-containing protein [Chloroflexia bacterium]|nr:MOSC domain-containing protein [Chloroflexia bacterium]
MMGTHLGVTCPSHHLIAVRAVYVAKPGVLGVRRGEPVISGIAKRPVAADTIQVGRTNLDGDGQGDRKNHGGPDKAVYAYPAEHLGRWRSEIGYGDGPAPFGENISIVGALEDAARIGDLWRWGSVVLQISQPRWPCFKLAMHSGDPMLPKRLVETNRCGWYLRVLTEGEAPVGGDIELIERHTAGVTVRDAFLAARKEVSPEVFQRVRGLDVLAPTWHTHLDNVWD